MKIKASGRLLPVLLALAALAVTVSVTSASADGHHRKADRVRSNDDGTKGKLSADLQQKVDDEATGQVTVVVSLDKSGSFISDAHNGVYDQGAGNCSLESVSFSFR